MESWKIFVLLKGMSKKPVAFSFQAESRNQPSADGDSKRAGKAGGTK